jgi:hypothetical protein
MLLYGTEASVYFTGVCCVRAELVPVARMQGSYVAKTQVGKTQGVL